MIDARVRLPTLSNSGRCQCISRSIGRPASSANGRQLNAALSFLNVNARHLAGSHLISRTPTNGKAGLFYIPSNVDRIGKLSSPLGGKGISAECDRYHALAFPGNTTIPDWERRLHDGVIMLRLGLGRCRYAVLQPPLLKRYRGPPQKYPRGKAPNRGFGGPKHH